MLVAEQAFPASGLVAGLLRDSMVLGALHPSVKLCFVCARTRVPIAGVSFYFGREAEKCCSPLRGRVGPLGAHFCRIAYCYCGNLKHQGFRWAKNQPHPPSLVRERPAMGSRSCWAFTSSWFAGVGSQNRIARCIPAAFAFDSEELKRQSRVQAAEPP